MHRLATTLFIAALALPGVARAELPEPPRAPSDEDVARARVDFVRGMSLAQRERWDEALDAFSESYARSGSPVALFNIASTLHALGRAREARDAFDRLLEDRELAAQTRARAEAERAAAAAQLARITVDAVPAGDARVMADGAIRETTSSRPIEVELDPGTRALAIEVPAHVRWDWGGAVEPGARFRITASFSRLPDAGAADAVPWIVGGAAALLVVAAIVAIVIADAEMQLDPRTAAVIRLP